MCGVSFSILLASAVAAEASARADNTFTGNVFCGPRSVARVLEYYGQRADLRDLILQTQWPEMEQGASLDSLATALESHGVYTATVTVDPDAEINWDAPAIVHLTDRGQEHYVVWLPPVTAGQNPRVWDGARSPAIRLGRFNAMRTGPVLLTSAHPISETTVVGRGRRTPGGLPRALTVLATGVASFVSGCLLASLYPARTFSDPGKPHLTN